MYSEFEELIIRVAHQFYQIHPASSECLTKFYREFILSSGDNVRSSHTKNRDYISQVISSWESIHGPNDISEVRKIVAQGLWPIDSGDRLFWVHNFFNFVVLIFFLQSILQKYQTCLLRMFKEGSSGNGKLTAGELLGLLTRYKLFEKLFVNKKAFLIIMCGEQEGSLNFGKEFTYIEFCEILFGLFVLKWGTFNLDIEQILLQQ